MTDVVLKEVMISNCRTGDIALRFMQNSDGQYFCLEDMDHPALVSFPAEDGNRIIQALSEALQFAKQNDDEIDIDCNDVNIKVGVNNDMPCRIGLLSNLCNDVIALEDFAVAQISREISNLAGLRQKAA